MQKNKALAGKNQIVHNTSYQNLPFKIPKKGSPITGFAEILHYHKEKKMMGIFHKNKKKQNAERNEINNRELQEQLANAAPGILRLNFNEELFKSTTDTFLSMHQ